MRFDRRTVGLGLVLALLLAAGGFWAEDAQPKNMTSILDRWRSEDVAEREAASEEVASGWEGWSEADLARLRAAREDPDAEVAGRARAAVSAVELHRKYGPRLEQVQALIGELAKPEGKVRSTMFINPGGPIVEWSPPMQELEKLGCAIEPLLIDALANESVRSEVAVVLSRTGGRESVAGLIRALPAHDRAERGYWLVYALWQLTGLEIGIDHKGFTPWDPEVRDAWQAWLDESGPYLLDVYDHPTTNHGWEEPRVEVDFEAKVAKVPRDEFRKEHPLVRYVDIKTWQDGTEYLQRLREYCLSYLIRSLSIDGYPEREVVLSLGWIDDPKAKHALESLRAEKGSMVEHDVAWALSLHAGEGSIPGLPPPASETRLEELRSQLKGGSLNSRVATAETLWGHGQKDGLPTLLEVVRLRPVDGTNIDAVREACMVLGRMGDSSAIGPLRELAGENLNGILGTGGSGWGCAGRPDWVALVRLGDEEAAKRIERSLQAGDPYQLAGCWPVLSDVDSLGLKRFLPSLVPLLAEGSGGRRVPAARTIIRLIDHGR